MKMSCPKCHGAGTLPDQELSPHFQLSEFIRSTVALERGLLNVPSPEVVDALRLLCVELLQPLRDRFGAILVTSGYRSPEVNAAVGGAPGSVHVLGHAADIVPVNSSIDEVMSFLAGRALPFDQAIDEGTHIHIARISPAGKQRMQLLVKRGGQHFVWEASDVA